MHVEHHPNLAAKPHLGPGANACRVISRILSFRLVSMEK
jgi:hypothetical protein